jgi:hypothetical protein
VDRGPVPDHARRALPSSRGGGARREQLLRDVTTRERRGGWLEGILCAILVGDEQ